MHDPRADNSILISRARDGERCSMDELLTSYRPYLKMIARLSRDARLRSKLDDSDLVQEATLLAARDFASFRGQTEPEFVGWLRTIITRVTIHAIRHHTAGRRDVALEQNLQQQFDASSELLATRLEAGTMSPSEHAVQRERSVMIAEVLDQLPPHYREVVLLRDFEGLTLEEVGQRMDRTAASVKKLWARAMVKIRQLLKGKA